MQSFRDNDGKMKPVFSAIENEMAQKELIAQVRKKGRFIGSRAWKVATPKSDYDYLIKYETLQDIFHKIEEKYPVLWSYKQIFEQSWGDSCDEERSREFYSIVLTLNGRKYNILAPIDVVNYRAWMGASNELDQLVGEDVIVKKQHRVDLFELFKRIYRDIYMPEIKLTGSKPDPVEDVPF